MSDSMHHDGELIPGVGLRDRRGGWHWKDVTAVRAPAHEDVSAHQHVVLSVVPGDGAFEGESFRKTLDWVGPRFRQGVVLVSDRIGVLNHRFRTGSTAMQAAKDWQGIQQRFLETSAPLFESTPCRWQFFSVSALLEQEACTPFATALRQSFQADESFRSQFQGLVADWLNTRDPGARQERYAVAMTFLDHLAVVAMLRGQGWAMHLHPGVSSALRWMNGDGWISLPGNLSSMVFVELAPRIWP